MTALLTWAETVFFRLAEMSGGAVACLVLSCAAWAISVRLRPRDWPIRVVAETANAWPVMKESA